MQAATGSLRSRKGIPTGRMRARGIRVLKVLKVLRALKVLMALKVLRALRVLKVLRVLKMNLLRSRQVATLQPPDKNPSRGGTSEK